MSLNNSQVLGVLKRMVSDQEALLHARGVIEAYMQAQEILIKLDAIKAAKENEIAEFGHKQTSEQNKLQSSRELHNREMVKLTNERDTLRAEVEALKAQVGQVKGSVDEAEAAKQVVLASYDGKIREQEKILQAVKDEIEALKKRFAA